MSTETSTTVEATATKIPRPARLHYWSKTTEITLCGLKIQPTWRQPSTEPPPEGREICSTCEIVWMNLFAFDD